MSTPSRTSLRIVAALTVAATALRLATLDVQSLWGDEAATVLLLRQSLPDMLGNLGASESAPPLYYVLAWLWTHVLGTGAVGVRSLSVLFGAATIPVAYYAVRPASERAGLWAAAITAVNPLTFYYAQEARAYALLILLAGLSFVAFQRLLEQEPTRRTLAFWGVTATLALLTHYFALFVVAGEVILLVRRHGVRRILPALVPFGLVGMALVPLAARQRRDGKSDWIEGTSLPSRIGQAPKQFLVGIDSPAELVLAALAGLVAVAAIALLLRRGSAAERRVALLAATVALVALALPMLLSLSGAIDLFNGRNVVSAWLPVAAVVAVGLGTAAAGRVGDALGAALCLVMLIAVIGVLGDANYQRDDYRAMIRGLPPTAQARLVILPENASDVVQLDDPRFRKLDGGSVEVSQLAFANFGERKIGKAPLDPVLPAGVVGFTPAGSAREGRVGVIRLAASAPQRLDVKALEKRLGEGASAVLQEPG